MRRLVAAALFFFGGYLALMVDLTPAPRITVQAPTEESIKAEMKREAQQKQIAIATRAALAVFRRHSECRPLAELVGIRAVEYSIPARIFAAQAIAESSCNPEAVSRTGDYGAWQVNAKIWRVSPSLLRDPSYNSAFAARILRGYIRQYGVVEGLHHYNGMGRPADEYSGSIMMIAYGRSS